VTFETIRRYYRVDRREIAFLKFILEACGGIAVLTTLDSEAGIVGLRIPTGCEAEVEMILQGLKTEIMMEAIRCEP